jgi:hypothetical protein
MKIMSDMGSEIAIAIPTIPSIKLTSNPASHSYAAYKLHNKSVYKM